jgi:hypothetical protein
LPAPLAPVVMPSVLSILTTCIKSMISTLIGLGAETGEPRPADEAS